jgi:hypothetical protein
MGRVANPPSTSEWQLAQSSTHFRISARLLAIERE